MERLTKKEETIMQIIWKIGRGIVKDIIRHIPPPEPPYSTVSSIVRILEEKGCVGHKAYGKTHEYFPLISKEEYRKLQLRNIVRDYFANSYKEVISFFAKEEEISAKELKEIIEMIENPEKNNEK